MCTVLDMASKTIITDDLDGTTGAETVTFSVNSRTYQIDLAPKNQRQLEKVLKPYMEVARPTNGTRPRSKGRRTVNLADVRSWAAANGIQVAAKGRVAQSVIEQYLASR